MKAVRVSDDAMAPRMHTGDVVYFDDTRGQVGHDVVLFGHDVIEQRCVRHLVGETDREWFVSTFAPRRRERLPKAEWPHCFTVWRIEYQPEVMEIDVCSWLDHVLAGGMSGRQHMESKRRRPTRAPLAFASPARPQAQN
jgi:hypothetical protein